MKAFYLVLIIAAMSNCVILSRLLGTASWFGTAGRPAVAALLILNTGVLTFLSGIFARLGAAAASALSGTELPALVTPLLAVTAVVLLLFPSASLVKARLPLQYHQFKRLLPLTAVTASTLSATLTSVPQPLLMSIVWLDISAAFFILLAMSFGAIRFRLNSIDVPAAFRGLPAELVCVGLMTLVLLAPLALTPAGAV